MRRLLGRDLAIMGLLALLPALAHAPAWEEGRLLGPGDGAALHYPLRALVWESLRRGEVPAWNPSIFSGTPLLASYRPGAFFPPMMAAAVLPPFAAFQVLVLFSLAAAGILTFLYLRRLGANRVGAYLAGLCFALGPYLVGHMDDTATLVAAPTLPLILLAAESHMNRRTPGRTAGLAGAVALLLLAGSPEAARAGGALLAGRLLVGHLLPSSPRGPSFRLTVLALLAGVALAAPQVLPTLVAAREAGRPVTGLATEGQDALPGATGLVLRYVSHTPAPSLALAALPLALTQTPVRVLGIALAFCLALQWGRGPLAAPGALALVFDLALAVLAGLSFSAQWAARRETLGRRLRAYFLFSCLASAAALSVSAAAVGPLSETLAGAVGVLALALILYFSLAANDDPLRAGVWMLPLTVSFLLQPHGRGLPQRSPTREQLEEGTATRESINRAMGPRREQRILTLARHWPREEALDLAYANLGALAGRRSANGYDPMVPARNLAVFDGMGSGGTLSGAFFRTDPGRLELLGIRWVQVPTSALTATADRFALGETLDLPLQAGQPRFFPVPMTAATEVRLSSSMADAVEVRQGTPVALVEVRLASGRTLPVYVRAGEETAEWAYDRSDVQRSVAHLRPRVAESWPGPDKTFEGHRYLGVLRLPGRYYVDGVRIERLPGPGRLTLSRLGVVDVTTGRSAPVSLTAGYVSDVGRFREAAAPPAVRLFEVPGSLGYAHVVKRLRLLPDVRAVLRALRAPREAGLEARLEAVAVAAEAEGFAVPDGAKASRAEVARATLSSLELHAEGPGLLVLTEGWDPGWSAAVDGHAARLLRVNHVQMGVALTGGVHRIVFRYRPRGLVPGLVLAALSATALAWSLYSGGRAVRCVGTPSPLRGQG